MNLKSILRERSQPQKAMCYMIRFVRKFQNKRTLGDQVDEQCPVDGRRGHWGVTTNGFLFRVTKQILKLDGAQFQSYTTND